MFTNDQYKGNWLPPKTICLTFDDGPGHTEGDGPGPKTLKLAEYLRDQTICGTFFSVGKFIEEHPEITKQVFELGHIIGNHTYDHPHLPMVSDDEVLNQIQKTHELISPYKVKGRYYFRAPYADFNAQNAKVLNERFAHAKDYVGTFYWDFNNNDFRCWELGYSGTECAKDHLHHILSSGKSGIVLMHDSTADIAEVKAKNRSLEAIQIMVPQLKQHGYKFVGLDQVPVSIW